MADQNITEQVQEILASPMDLPSTFWDYMVKRWLRDAPVFPISQVFGYLSATRLAYVEITSPVSVTAVTEGTANTIFTYPAVTMDGQARIWIEFFAPLVDTPSAQAMFFILFQDGVVVERSAAVYGANSELSIPVLFRRSFTPTLGVHTYSVRAYMSGGTGTVTAGASGSGNYGPAYGLITKS